MSEANDSRGTPRSVLVLLLLPVFVLVIDTTFMNVSINTLVDDLDTNVAGIQTAVTVYTLVMAAFMVTGGKLARIWGPRRAYRVGLATYGIGGLVTALSIDLPMLIVGWSVLEGLGAALVLPAVNALVVANVAAGRARTAVYGSIAAVAAAGAAVGPLIGGAFTTYLSWRAAFGCEVVLIVVVLVASRRLADVDTDRPGLDVGGVVLSAIGLSLVVFGLLQAGPYGWVTTRRPVTIGDATVLDTGEISPLIVLTAAGGVVLVAFALWERRRGRRGRDRLIDPAVLRTAAVIGGGAVAIAQYGAQSGVLFVLPVFMQVQLGFSAFETGLAVLPMSIALLIVSQGSTRVDLPLAPARLIQIGIALSAMSGVVLAFAIDSTSGALSFLPGLVLFGVGLGLALPRLINFVVSAVEPVQSSEASGLLSTGQNLGRSLGTAVAGGILLSVAVSGTLAAVDSDPNLTDAQQAQVDAAVEAAGQLDDDEAIRGALPDVPSATVDAVLDAASTARDDALRPTMLAIAALSLAALLASLVLLRSPRAS